MQDLTYRDLAGHISPVEQQQVALRPSNQGVETKGRCKSKEPLDLR